MDTIILGGGGLGRAIAGVFAERDGRQPRVIGRPVEGRHAPSAFAGADVVIDASLGPAVESNVAAALEGGCSRFVIATTGWDGQRSAVEERLVAAGAAAVASPNFSLGVNLFGRLVDAAVGLFGSLESFDPYVVEWHRRTKVDRPSGTARDLARRILAAHPRKTRLASGPDAPAPDELDVAVIRAGASPGMHLVGFDAPGETLELRLTARDRTAYAAGARAAAEWLLVERRQPGFHSFDQVVDDLVRPTTAVSRSDAAMA